MALAHEEGELRISLVRRDDEGQAAMPQLVDEPHCHPRLHLGRFRQLARRLRLVPAPQQLQSLFECLAAELAALVAALHRQHSTVEHKERPHPVFLERSYQL